MTHLYISSLCLSSLGKFGRLGPHLLLWAGLACVFLVSGRAFGMWYGKELSAWIGSSVMWLRWYVKGMSIRRYLKTLTIQSEAEEGREIKRQLEEHIYRKPEQRGFSRVWSMALLVVLAASWTGWTYTGFVAIRDHQRVQALEQELHNATQAPANTIVRRGIIVTSRRDWSFTAWTWNHATQAWEDATYNVCHYDEAHQRLKLTSEIQPGAIIKLFQWQQDTEHACMDLSNTTFSGYTIRRDENAQPILASYAGPPTWRPSAEPAP